MKTYTYLVGKNITHVAGLLTGGSFHQANDVALLGPIAGMEAQREHDVPHNAIRTHNPARTAKTHKTM